MASSLLLGRRGWTTVASLTATLGVLVSVQLPSAAADSPAARPVAVTPLLGPALPSPGVVRAAVARTVPASGLAAAAPVVPAAAAPVATPVAVAPVAARSVAKPAVPPVAKPAKPARKARAADVCSGPDWQQRRGAAALASLRGTRPAGWTLSYASARSGYLGLTHLDERRIELFVRSCAKQSTELLRHVAAHELGHARDTALMTAATRRQWMAARGIPARTSWYGCSGCTDFATPAGDFAEVYAQWARGASTNRSTIAGDATPAQLTALAARFFGA